MGKTAKRTSESEDKLASAKQQGQAQFDSIVEMVEALHASGQPWGDDETRAVEEDALSVQVRSGWYQPGASREEQAAEEYEILLCTGGPACRIIGELDRGSPTTAQMQVQDWFQPWTNFEPVGKETEATLLTYASVFYFGD